MYYNSKNVQYSYNNSYELTLVGNIEGYVHREHPHNLRISNYSQDINSSKKLECIHINFVLKNIYLEMRVFKTTRIRSTC